MGDNENLGEEIKEPPKKEASAFFLSFIIHAILLIVLVTATYRVALPPGNVSTELEFTPEGGTTKGHISEVDSNNNVPPQVETAQPEETLPVKKSESVIKANKPPTTLPAKGEVPLQQDAEEKSTEKLVPMVEKVDAQSAAEEDLAKQEEAKPPKELPVAKPQTPPQDLENLKAAQEESVATAEAENSENSEAGGAGEPDDQAGGQDVVDASGLKAMPGNPRPEYPVMARLRRIQGTSVLRFKVTQQGLVENVRIEKSSGDRSLDESAAKAYSKFRYQPGQEGEARAAVVFRLSGEAKPMPSQLRRSK